MAAAAVVLILACVLSIQTGRLQAVSEEYQRQEQQLEQQWEEESQRTQELEEYQVYVQTRDYIERVAREQLGLVNPNETVVKPEE